MVVKQSKVPTTTNGSSILPTKIKRTKSVGAFDLQHVSNVSSVRAVTDKMEERQQFYFNLVDDGFGANEKDDFPFGLQQTEDKVAVPQFVVSPQGMKKQQEMFFQAMNLMEAMELEKEIKEQQNKEQEKKSGSMLQKFRKNVQKKQMTRMRPKTPTNGAEEPMEGSMFMPVDDGGLVQKPFPKVAHDESTCSTEAPTDFGSGFGDVENTHEDKPKGPLFRISENNQQDNYGSSDDLVFTLSDEEIIFASTATTITSGNSKEINTKKLKGSNLRSQLDETLNSLDEANRDKAVLKLYLDTAIIKVGKLRKQMKEKASQALQESEFKRLKLENEVLLLRQKVAYQEEEKRKGVEQLGVSTYVPKEATHFVPRTAVESFPLSPMNSAGFVTSPKAKIVENVALGIAARRRVFDKSGASTAESEQNPVEVKTNKATPQKPVMASPKDCAVASPKATPGNHASTYHKPTKKTTPSPQTASPPKPSTNQPIGVSENSPFKSEIDEVRKCMQAAKAKSAKTSLADQWLSACQGQ